MSKSIDYKNLFSASEIVSMGLPGLPTTIANIHARAKKEEWHFETKIGLGGMRKVYMIPLAYLPGYQPLTTEELENVKPQRAEAIAEKAKTQFGDQIDQERLTYAIRFLDDYLNENKIHIDSGRKSELIVALYNLMKTSENEADIRKLLKLVA